MWTVLRIRETTSKETMKQDWKPKFIAFVVIILLGALLLWTLQPLEPFGYSLGYLDWLAISYSVKILYVVSTPFKQTNN